MSIKLASLWLSKKSQPSQANEDSAVALLAVFPWLAGIAKEEEIIWKEVTAKENKLQADRELKHPLLPALSSLWDADFLQKTKQETRKQGFQEKGSLAVNCPVGCCLDSKALPHQGYSQVWKTKTTFLAYCAGQMLWVLILPKFRNKQVKIKQAVLLEY